MKDITMPQFTELMEEGTIVKWLKREGDAIAVGDLIVEIDADKANVEYESEFAGILVEIVVPEGANAGVGSVIARVGGPSDLETRGLAAAAQTAPPVPATTDAAAAQTTPPVPGTFGEAAGRTSRITDVSASPIVRRLAEENGIDLSLIQGSGPDGRIVRSDIEAWLKAVPQPPKATTGKSAESRRGQVEVVPLTQPQRIMAQRMAETKSLVPHFYLTLEADMTDALKERAARTASAGSDAPGPSINDLIIKACALALRQYPRVNSSFADGVLHQYSRVNVGFAVAADHYVVVPVVVDADRRDIQSIADTTRALARKVSAGQVTPEEISGGTFTVSNLGMYGVSVAPVINPPEAAILGVGKIGKQPKYDDAGNVVRRDVVTLILSCDHRVLPGADGAAFLQAIRELLEDPARLWGG